MPRKHKQIELERLTAAAPDMFRALMVFVNAADHWGNPPWCQDAYDIAREAIALAVNDPTSRSSNADGA